MTASSILLAPQGILIAALLFLALYWLGLAALGALANWRSRRTPSCDARTR